MTEGNSNGRGEIWGKWERRGEGRGKNERGFRERTGKKEQESGRGRWETGRGVEPK